MFASSGGDRSVFVWDVATGVTTRRLAGHMGKVNAVEFNTDTSVLASGASLSISNRVLSSDSVAQARTTRRSDSGTYGTWRSCYLLRSLFLTVRVRLDPNLARRSRCWRKPATPCRPSMLARRPSSPVPWTATSARTTSAWANSVQTLSDVRRALFPPAARSHCCRAGHVGRTFGRCDDTPGCHARLARETV